MQPYWQASVFGVVEGPHPQPWTAAYHREAVRVYAESLPMSYERRVGSLFIHSAEAMDAFDIPSGLADDWLITKAYMRNASSAIADWLAEKQPHGERAPTNTQLSSPESKTHSRLR